MHWFCSQHMEVTNLLSITYQTYTLGRHLENVILSSGHFLSLKWRKMLLPDPRPLRRQMASMRRSKSALSWTMKFPSGMEVIAAPAFIVQYRHLIPAPVDRTSGSAWLYKHPWITCQKMSQTHWWPKNYFLLWGHACIFAQETGWQSGMRSCIMPGLPTHLMQELNGSTVHALLAVSHLWQGLASLNWLRLVSQSNL